MNSVDDRLLYISLKFLFRVNLKLMLPSSRVGGSVFVPSVAGATVVETSEVRATVSVAGATVVDSSEV